MAATPKGAARGVNQKSHQLDSASSGFRPDDDFPGDRRDPVEATLEIDLLAEWLAMPGLTSQHIRRLAAAGVPAASWITAGHIATPRISTTGRLFVPDPLGHPALVLPVYDGPPVGPDNPDPSVPLLDLLAFRLEEPERWSLRIGRQGLVLGKQIFIDSMVTGSNARVCATPLAWLQGGCEGICLLDLASDFHEMERLRAHLADLEAA